MRSFIFENIYFNTFKIIRFELSFLLKIFLELRILRERVGRQCLLVYNGLEIHVDNILILITYF